MGRFSQFAADECSICGVDVDIRFAERHQHNHSCQRDEILWDDAPDFTRSTEFIAWYGTCEVCGRRIYDCYIPEMPLYDARTDDAVKTAG